MRLPLCFALVAIVLTGKFVSSQAVLDTFFTTEFNEYSIEKQTVYAVCTVEAPKKVVEQAGLSLTTVLDTSGSMEGTPIQLLKRTVQFLVTKLLESSGAHSLGVIGYETVVSELSPVVSVDDSTAASLISAIENILAGGATFLSGGLNTGVEQQANVEGKKVKNVYLFTDGLPTVGPTSVTEVLSSLESVLEAKDELITISTFGFGENLDFQLLSAIAEVGGGETYIISSEDDIPAAFGKALGGLLSIVASDMELILTPQTGCKIKSIMAGGVYNENNGIYNIRYENLYANELRDILIEIEVDEGKSGDQFCVEAALAYVDPIASTKTTAEPVVLQINRVGEAEEAPPDVKVEENRLKFVTAEALAEATASINQGDTEAAAEAIAVAQASVEVSVLVDTPEIQALKNDLERITELLEQSQGNQAVQSARISELESTLRRQRSTFTDDEFETAAEVDTEEQKEIQKETRDAVLSEIDLTATADATARATVLENAPENGTVADQTQPTDEIQSPLQEVVQVVLENETETIPPTSEEEEAVEATISPEINAVENLAQIPEIEAEGSVVVDTPSTEEPSRRAERENLINIAPAKETNAETVVQDITPLPEINVVDNVGQVPEIETRGSVVVDTPSTEEPSRRAERENTINIAPAEETNTETVIPDIMPMPELDSVYAVPQIDQ
eukprot:g6056.t1